MVTTQMISTIHVLNLNRRSTCNGPLDAGYLLLDAGCLILVRMLGDCDWILATGYSILVTGFWMLLLKYGLNR